MSKVAEEKWLFEISPKKNLFSLNFKEIWQYRDLLVLFIKRDIVTVYKQTVLGPLWFFIQPLFTSLIFTLIFNNLAKIETNNINAILFNMAGISMWNYFKVCLSDTSNTFAANQNIFSKVYFPRVIVPLSKVIGNLFKFGIQLLLFVGFYIYFYIQGDPIQPTIYLLFFPILILTMAMLGIGFGMIFSSMTTKYRDLSNLITFGVQLLMYLSAVMYPISEIKKKIPDYAWIVEINPIAHVIEAFRKMIFGMKVGETFDFTSLLIGLGSAIIIFLIGLVIFNRTEKNFIDTV